MIKEIKTINFRTLLQIFILLGFSVLISILVINGTAKKYVHPRIVPYLIFSIILFIIIALCMSRGLHNKHYSSISLWGCLIFVVPLVLFIVIPPADHKLLHTSISGLNLEYCNNQKVSDVFSWNRDTSSVKNSRALLTLLDNKIVLTERNYSSWIDEIYTNTDKYIGKRIYITGFVHKEQTLMANQFVIARLLMTCCTADATTLGLLCSYNKEAEGIKEGSWAQIEGVITNLNSSGKIIPCIYVVHVKSILKPENEYIYAD